ncbi:kinesin-like protein Klp5 [Globomyces sp. JEL0801]|nr:kinesin-like protein Klp5 [Globomyces sp. JEL0801]
MTENISVFVRIRPLLESEKQKKIRRQSMLTLDTPLEDSTISVLDNPRKRKGDKKHFCFDSVLGEAASQKDVFEATTKPLLTHVLDGYHATVFAYGATGIDQVVTFSLIDQMASTTVFEITLSFLEVYNETIRYFPSQLNVRDLFTKSSKSLDIREDDSRVIVAGLSEHVPKNVDHVMKLLIQGNENRTKAYTAANAASSRSHAVLQIHIKQRYKSYENDQIKIATLSIIDLAGSERASATLNKGERLHIDVGTHVAQYPKLIEALRAEIVRLKLVDDERRNSTAGESAQFENILQQCIDKSTILQNKLQEKRIEHQKLEMDVALNDYRIENLKTLLLAITNGTKLEERRSLNEAILEMNQVLDDLHGGNTTMLHNIDQCKQSIERYEAKLTKLYNAHDSADFKARFNIAMLSGTLKRETACLELEKKYLNVIQSKTSEENTKLVQINLQFFQTLLKIKDKASTANLAQLLKLYASTLSGSDNNLPIEHFVTYDTCTEDEASDMESDFIGQQDMEPLQNTENFNSLLSNLEVQYDRNSPFLSRNDSYTLKPELRMEVDNISNDGTLLDTVVKVKDNCHTPKQKIHSDEDQEATPVQRKRTKKAKTPCRSVKKTPRRKPRMSLIPVLRPSSSAVNPVNPPVLMNLRSRIKGEGKLANDYVEVAPSSTFGDVLQSLLSVPSVDDFLDPNEGTKVQQEYRKKYEEKLQKAAREKGFKDVEDMLKKKQKDDQEREKKLAKEAEELQNQKNSNPSNPENDKNKNTKPNRKSDVPSYTKSLDEIVKLDLLVNETSEKIGQIWNAYHFARKGVSAALDAEFYDKLHARSVKYPMGHQVYFTPLLEYQLNKENARPSFSMTFYTDLKESKKIVLMVGELSGNGTLTLPQAQHLVYQIQLFYVLGSDIHKKQVEKFWNDPANFDYNELIESLNTLQ